MVVPSRETNFSPAFRLLAPFFATISSVLWCVVGFASSSAPLLRCRARVQGREVKVTDVVFFGLKKVMPLMTEGLLQFPTLASQYFSLVSAKNCLGSPQHVPVWYILVVPTRFVFGMES